MSPVRSRGQRLWEGGIPGALIIQLNVTFTAA